MSETPPDSPPARHGTVVSRARETTVIPPPSTTVLTPEGEAALAAAASLARNAAAPATLRAYKADWTHFSRHFENFEPAMEVAPGIDVIEFLWASMDCLATAAPHRTLRTRIARQCESFIPFRRLARGFCNVSWRPRTGCPWNTCCRTTRQWTDCQRFGNAAPGPVP